MIGTLWSSQFFFFQNALGDGVLPSTECMYRNFYLFSAKYCRDHCANFKENPPKVVAFKVLAFFKTTRKTCIQSCVVIQ